MQFVNPSFLYGLVALVIPIAIHLFNFRRYRKVYFSNVELLRNFQKKTRKQSELLHYLVLAARLLALTALILAFAQPYIPSGEKLITGSINVAGIFVDNSFSMEVGNTEGRKLDEAKKKAADIASAYDADDLFQLLTNDFEGRHQRLVSRDEFLLMLRDVKPSPLYRTFSEIIHRQEGLLRDKRYPSATSFILSDFQTATVLSSIPDSLSEFSVFLVPSDASASGNLFIDSCWFSNPILRMNQTAELNVRIINISDNSLEKIPLKLNINGEQRAVSAIDIGPEESFTTMLKFSATTQGEQKATVEITDYPVIFDDVYYLTFEVSEKIPVLAINQDDENIYLKSVFALDSVLQLNNSPVRQTNFSALEAQRLVILNGTEGLSSGANDALVRFVEQGGNLIVFPPREASTESIGLLLNALAAPYYGLLDTVAQRVSKISRGHVVFKDVFEKNIIEKGNLDLPIVKRHFKISNPTKGLGDDLMTLDNGDPFLTMKSYGRGRVFVSAVALDDSWGNWPRHALFVPVMLNIAFQSENQSPLMYYLNNGTGIDLGNFQAVGDNVLRISREDGFGEFIPEVRAVNGRDVFFVHDYIGEAGFYLAKDGKKIVKALAFNYNRTESDLRCADLPELNAIEETLPGVSVLADGKRNISKLIAERNHGRKLWKWFILATLLFIMIEVLLLRFFKKSSEMGI